MKTKSKLKKNSFEINFDKLHSKLKTNYLVNGMSGDYKLATNVEGTMVRIGSSILEEEIDFDFRFQNIY
jgi:uncharacterized pyridoxal phosphate-containing UPF0001 family protein